MRALAAASSEPVLGDLAESDTVEALRRQLQEKEQDVDTLQWNLDVAREDAEALRAASPGGVRRPLPRLPPGAHTLLISPMRVK